MAYLLENVIIRKYRFALSQDIIKKTAPQQSLTNIYVINILEKRLVCVSTDFLIM